MSARIGYSRPVTPRWIEHVAPAALVATLAFALAAPADATAPQATPPAAPSAPAVPSVPQAGDLQRRIEQLEKELAAAQERIRQLEADLAAAQAAARAGAPAGGSAPATPPATAADAAIPADQALVSPDNFLRFAQQTYAAEFTEASMAAGPGESANGAATRLQRRIDRWTAAMTREWRKSVRWLVQHGKSQTRGDGLAIQVTVLDEASGAPLGESFEIVLDARQAKRYNERVGRLAPPERWVLSAVFAPRFVANPDRVDAGVFNHPPFVGPGVELRQEFFVESFVPARQEQPKSAPPAAPSAPAGTAPSSP